MNKSSYDPISDMFTTLAPIGIIFFIVGLVFFIIGIAYIVRLWFVQTATFEIQRDLAEIKGHLLQSSTENVNTTPDSVVGDANGQDTTSTQNL